MLDPAVTFILDTLVEVLGPRYDLADLLGFIEAQRGVPVTILPLPAGLPIEITGLCVPLTKTDLVLYGGDTVIPQRISQLHELAHLLLGDVPRHKALPHTTAELLACLRNYSQSDIARFRMICRPDADGAEVRAEQLATCLLHGFWDASAQDVARWIG